MRKAVFSVIMTISLLFVQQLLWAQVANVTNMAGGPLKENRYSGVQGSPYLNDLWQIGSIIQENGSVAENLQLKYDLYRDGLAMLKEGKAFEITSAFIKGFTIRLSDIDNPEVKKAYTYKNGFEIEGFDKSNFFQVHYEGKRYQLLSKTIIKLVQQPPVYGTTTRIDAFSSKDEYYLVKEGNVSEIKRSKKSIIQTMGIDKKTAEAIIKKNKLNLSRVEDIIIFLISCEAQ